MQKDIIHFLKKSSGYISGEDISRELKISRAAIWKYMQELRKEGYDIVAVPHLGYQLKGLPDKLLEQEIHFNLPTKYMGRKIFHHESLPSTMDMAFRLGMEGGQEGTVVIAETQTKGKGRLGRHWSSPKGKGIYMSVILRPQLTPLQVSQLTLLTAVAVCQALRKVSGLSVNIKWPNDLLIDNKKVAGILIELSAEMDRVRFVVIGIGINVNTPSSQLPQVATSLKQKGNKVSSRVELLQEVLLSLEHWYELYKKQGFDAVKLKWKEFASMLGRRIRISDVDGAIEGEAMDLDDSGALIVRQANGITIKRMTGDVIQIQ